MSLEDFIIECSTYANDSSNNVQIAHGAGQPVGIQSMELGIFGNIL